MISSRRVPFILGIVIMWVGINIVQSDFITYLGLLTAIIYGVEMGKK